jgi:hypothetical protein
MLIAGIVSGMGDKLRFIAIAEGHKTKAETLISEGNGLIRQVYIEYVLYLALHPDKEAPECVSVTPDKQFLPFNLH